MNTDKIFEVARRMIGSEKIRAGDKSDEEIAQLIVNVIRNNAGPGPSSDTDRTTKKTTRGRAVYKIIPRNLIGILQKSTWPADSGLWLS